MNGKAFDKFLKKYAVSVRQFSAVCSEVAYISIATVQRLKGSSPEKVTPRTLQHITPTLQDACRRIMEEKKVPHEEIEKTMKEIYKDEYKAAATDRKALTEDELDFFKFQRDPFAISSDPRDSSEVFISDPLRELADKVSSAIRFQEFVAVLGPVGAGKTSLKQFIHADLRQSGRKKVHFIYPKFAEMGRVEAGGIVSYLLDHFGVERQKQRLMLAQKQLERHLEKLADAGELVVMVIDECHRLSSPTLTSLKNFLEIGSGGFQRYMALVLYGQPRFATKLQNVDFQEIAERIVIHEMPGMESTVSAYIDHRVGLASKRKGADLFTFEAIQLIASRASTPLAIGNLANLGLHNAYTKGDEKVTARHIEDSTEPQAYKTSAGK